MKEHSLILIIDGIFIWFEITWYKECADLFIFGEPYGILGVTDRRTDSKPMVPVANVRQLRLRLIRNVN